MARGEKEFRSFKPPKAGSLFSEATGAIAEVAVIFVEHSGQEALDSIRHFSGVAYTDDPTQELVDAVNRYLISKAG